MTKIKKDFFLVIGLVFLFFLKTPILFCQETDPFYLNLFQNAQKSFVSKNYKEAIRDFEIAAFGLVEEKTLRAKAYVYLSLSHFYLNEMATCEKYLKEAAALIDSEEFEKLQILESAWPDLEKLLTSFGIGNTQKEEPLREVEKPKNLASDSAQPEKKVDPKETGKKDSREMNKEAAEASPGQVKTGDLIPLEQADVPPVATKRVLPNYPKFTFPFKIEGQVAVKALVSENGDVIKTEIIRGIRGFPEFNHESERSVRQWKFRPASKKGVKVKVWVQVTVDFKLKG